MNKGLVIEETSTHVIVMTPDGDFKKLSVQDKTCKVGEEIHFPTSYRSLNIWKYAASAAAAVLLLVALVSVWLGLQPTPVIAAYITLDINPSVELGIDRKQRVRELRGLNPEGEQIVESIEADGRSFIEVASEIVDKADVLVESKYPEREKTMIVTSTWVDQGAESEMEQEAAEQQLAIDIKQQIETIMTSKPLETKKIKVMALSAPKALRDEAIKEGVSTAKLALNLIANQRAKDVGNSKAAAAAARNDEGNASKAIGETDWEAWANLESLGEAETLTRDRLLQLLSDKISKEIEKEARKAEREAEKDARKADRDAEKDARKADRDAEKDARKAVREAEKDARKAERD